MIKNCDKKELKLSIIGCIGFFLYFILSELEVYFPAFFGINIGTLSLNLKVLYLLLYEIMMMVVFFLLYRKHLIEKFKDFKKNFKTYFKEYFKYWEMAFGLMLISNMIILLIKPDAMANNEAAVRDTLLKAPFYMYFSAVFFAPFMEELTFRQSLRNVFKNDKLFIFISGFIFGGLHVFGSLTSWFDLLYLFPYCIPGFIFAYTLVKSDNIFVPMSLHFTHNGLLMTVQLILMLVGISI